MSRSALKNLLVMLVAFAGVAAAQGSGGISGTVSDPSGAAIPGAPTSDARLAARQ